MTVTLKFKRFLPGLLSAVLLLPGLQSAELKADPTRPEALFELPVAGSPAQAAEALPKLSMIRSQGTRHQALIDGQWRKAGDPLGAYQIRSISASQVILVREDRRLTLNLFQTTTTTK